MIKKALLILFSLVLLAYAAGTVSCTKSTIEPKPVAPEDSILGVDQNHFFFTGKIGSEVVAMQSNHDSVTNGVSVDTMYVCGFPGNNYTRQIFYFDYSADSSRVEALAISFYKCVSDTTNAFSDSVFVDSSYTFGADTLAGVSVTWLAPDSVLWSTEFAKLSNQDNSTFELTQVDANFDGFSALQVRGTVSCKLFDIDGNSIDLVGGTFYSRAWSFYK